METKNKIEDFNKWNEIKKEKDEQNNKKYFYDRDIWFLNLGKNIGFEQDGKGNEFLRPVLIYKKFSRRLFLGMPLTKTKKEEKFYFNLKIENKETSIILSQIRLFDSKRLKYKLTKISEKDFEKIKKQFTDLTQ